MLKVIVLEQLCQNLMPETYKYVMSDMQPPDSNYLKSIDRRLEGCYSSFLDIYGLTPGLLNCEVELFEVFLSNFTDEASHRARSQVLRLEEIKRVTKGESSGISISDALKITEPSRLEERLRFYEGWFIPNIGMDGQYVDLSCVYNQYGASTCSKMHSSLINYTQGMHRETARAKTQAVIILGDILTRNFNSADQMKSCLHLELVGVLEKLRYRFFGGEKFKTDSNILFCRSITVLNEFYIAYGFVDQAAVPLSPRIAKAMLGGGLKVYRFN